MPTAHCLNCRGALASGMIFCPHCGQRTDTARLTWTELLRELMHSFVNVERGPFALAWALVTRPGRVAREYVRGRRRRHYGPFATLVVLVGAATLLAGAAGYRALAQDGLPSAPTDLLQRHFNLLLLVQLPLLGAICAVVFRRDRLTLPEHMVLVAYALCVRAAALAVLLPCAALAASSEPTVLQVDLFWAGWDLYFGWAASQFYRGPRLAAGIRGVVAAALGHSGIMLLVKLFGMAYERLA